MVNHRSVNHSRRLLLRSASTLALGLVSSRLSLAEQKSRSKSNFTPPNQETRRKAVGSLDGLSAELKRAFDPGDDFEPLAEPKSGDWLAEHKETPQSFSQFVTQRPHRPDGRRSMLYLVPFGEFDPQWSPSMADLESCASAFFGITTKALPAQPLDAKNFTTRQNSGKRQFLTTDILRVLPKMMPADGFAILGITIQDLYPDPAWNYVFGQASLKDRSGIYSFARYDPQFWGEKRDDEAKNLLLVRSLGVLFHETCHMFGMTHCVYYHCLINGCNNLDESDRTPMHLCPICLRKLHHSVGFNVVTRYETLLKEYRRLKIDEEAEWLEKRLKFLKAP